MIIGQKLAGTKGKAAGTDYRDIAESQAERGRQRYIESVGPLAATKKLRPGSLYS